MNNTASTNSVLDFYRRVGMSVLVIGCLAITIAGPFQFGAKPATAEHPALPYGIEWIKQDHGAGPRDFFSMREFARQVWSHENRRPYSIPGQEQLTRSWFPYFKVGMPVAYAPLFFFWYYPFLLVPPGVAYVSYCFLEIALLIFLFQFYFFPRLKTVEQTRCLFLAFFSISFGVCFRIGQNPVITTTLLVLGWTTLNHSMRDQFYRGNWPRHLLLALPLFLLSAKPNHALVLGATYLAAGAFIPIIIALGGFALVCLYMTPYLGGWPTWLTDYLHLMNSYYPGGMGNYIAYGPTQSSNLASFLEQMTPVAPVLASAICKIIWPGITLVFLFLCWLKKISLREFFILNFANFLLFCPSFSNSDDWTIALLIAESTFFLAPRLIWLKMLLLVGAVDLCQVHPTPWEDWPIPFICKLILLGWLAYATFFPKNEAQLGPIEL